MYRNPVEASPEPIRGHYVKLLDDYLDLLKKTLVTLEGELVRTESTIDPAVVRNVLQLLAAAQLLDAQHGEPSSEEGADSSKAANVLTAQQIVLRSVNGQEVKVVGGDGQTVQLVMKESDVLTRSKSYNSNRKGRLRFSSRWLQWVCRDGLPSGSTRPTTCKSCLDRAWRMTTPTHKVHEYLCPTDSANAARAAYRAEGSGTPLASWRVPILRSCSLEPVSSLLEIVLDGQSPEV